MRILYIIFFVSSPFYIYSIKDSLKIIEDTSFVLVNLPDEKELFNHLDYSTGKKHSVNPVTELLNFIIKKIFSTDNEVQLDRIRKIFTWIIILLSLFGVYRIVRKYGWGLPFLSEKHSAPVSSAFSDINKPLKEYPFDEWIEKYVKEKDYRQAYRWLFLKILYHLEKNHLIRFSPEKTIREYKDMMSKTPYYAHFLELSLVFEYVWYGKFSMNEDFFMSMKNKTRELDKEMAP